jgi:hypothetical protein
VTVVAEDAALGDLDRAHAAALAADADAGRVLSLPAERRAAVRADVLGPAVVALLLVAELLLEAADELFQIERLEHLEEIRERHLARGALLEPLLDRLGDPGRGLQPAEELREREVVRVEERLRLHERRAREVVEAGERFAREAARDALEEREPLVRRDLHALRAELVEEVEEDGRVGRHGCRTIAGPVPAEEARIRSAAERRHDPNRPPAARPST